MKTIFDSDNETVVEITDEEINNLVEILEEYIEKIASSATSFYEFLFLRQ